MSPAWSLLAIGVLAGVSSMWLFRRTADRHAIRQAVNRIQASLLEFWLYVDEPSLIFRTWRGLLSANVRLLRLMLLPAIALSLPFVPLFFWLDATYGHSPLTLGQAALVTVQLEQSSDSAALVAPDGIAVETPPVRVYSRRQVSWRIRPSRPLAGSLECRLGATRIRKTVAAGGGLRRISERRTRSLLELVRYPTESPIPSGPVEWIEVSYPATTVPLFGMDAHWSVWFVLGMFAGAVAACWR